MQERGAAGPLQGRAPGFARKGAHADAWKGAAVVGTGQAGRGFRLKVAEQLD